MPKPSEGLLQSGRSHKQAESPAIPANDPLKHFKVNLMDPETRDSSPFIDIAYNRSGGNTKLRSTIMMHVEYKKQHPWKLTREIQFKNKRNT